jgi:hypothetical protein
LLVARWDSSTTRSEQLWSWARAPAQLSEATWSSRWTGWLLTHARNRPRTDEQDETVYGGCKHVSVGMYGSAGGETGRSRGEGAHGYEILGLDREQQCVQVVVGSDVRIGGPGHLVGKEIGESEGVDGKVMEEGGKEVLGSLPSRLLAWRITVLFGLGTRPDRQRLDYLGQV